MKSAIIAILVTVVLAGCGAHSTDTQTQLTGKAAALAKTIAAGEDHVTAQELSDWIIKDQRDFELVDIRDKAEFDTGHIDGARNLALAGLFSEQILESLPPGRRVVVYSNGSAHAAQATLLLRLAGREALALLGGYNYWQAYLSDPVKAGVAEMDPAERIQYQAVSYFFKGDYVAEAGLQPSVKPQDSAADNLGLGLALGLGSEEIQKLGLTTQAPRSAATSDSLGLGLGGDAAGAVQQPIEPEPGKTKKLLIKAEC